MILNTLSHPLSDSESEEPLKVVGICASAGGLESFKKFFEHLTPSSNIAYILIQHLETHHESLMAELLSHATTMKVSRIEQGTKIERNNIYVIPPNKYVTIKNSVLSLEEIPSNIKTNKTMDLFLTSLAYDQKEKAIAIVLSGTGNDGVHALELIKAEGGMVIAEDPKTSLYPDLPKHAIATGFVDHIAPIKEMPCLLQNEPGCDEHYILNIMELLNKHTSNDYTLYKKTTFLRRLARRMSFSNITTYREYLALLKSFPKELDKLNDDLMINVTSFFRNPQNFEVLINELLPTIEQAPEKPLRIWIPGCSSGEEAYSLIILLQEKIEELKLHTPLQVFATDIDKDAIDVARKGVYPLSIQSSVSLERLEKFFDKIDEGYRVKENVRKCVLFSLHNLLKDPPFCNLNLLSCRNLLIYLKSDIQRELIRMFYFSLNSKGILFLGNHETIGRENKLFEIVSKRHKIYKKSSSFPLIPKVKLPISPSHPSNFFSSLNIYTKDHTKNLYESVKNQLQDLYVPPAVLINSRYEILYYFGSTDPYLKTPVGLPSSNLLTLVRGNLASKIRRKLKEINEDSPEIELSPSCILIDQKENWVRIKIHALKSHEGKNLFLVTFIKTKEEYNHIPLESHLEKEGSYVTERELNDLRQYMHEIIEDLEESNEELKVSHEVSLSANEELQAANEEMEATKEELQSLNEELTTVNCELQEKIEEQEKTNNDIINLLKSTDIATVFVDNDLNIKRLTAKVKDIFNITEADINRYIGIFNIKADYNLINDTKYVIENTTIVEKEIYFSDTHQWFLRRVTPYHTTQGKILGAVIVYSDVTSIKKAQKILEQSETELRKNLDALPLRIAYLNKNRKFIFYNKAYGEWTGTSHENFIGQDFKQFMPANLYQEVNPLIDSVLEEKKQISFIYKANMPQEKELYQRVSLVPDINEKGEVNAFFLFMLDKTESYLIIESLQKEKEQLEKHIVKSDEDLIAEIKKRKETEKFLSHSRQFLNKIISFMPDPLLVKDGNFDNIIVNDSFCALLNKTPEELLGKAIESNVKKDQKRIKEEDNLAFQDEYFSTERKIINNKKSSYFIVQKISFRGEDGNKYLLCIYQNITTMRNTETRLKKLIQKLRQSNTQLENYAYMCSHDLKEPMRAISRFSEIMEAEYKDALDETGKKYINYILNSSKRMGLIIQSAFTYATINKPKKKKQDVDCNKLIEKALEDLEFLIKENHAMITHDNLPTISSYPEDLYQVFQNLISNAIKFKGENNPYIHIGSKIEKNKVLFWVKDNGRGIKKEYHKMIFRMFTRFSHNETYKGAGIGLAICKNIVESLKGTIWVESEVGKGTTFYFSLPMKLFAERLTYQ